MGESTVLLAALSIVTLVAGALIWVVKFLFTKNDVTLNKLADSIEKSAKASEAQVKSLDARDARDRVFQDHVIASFTKLHKSVKVLDDKADEILLEAKKEQTVKHQTVEHQTIIEG